MDITPPVLVNYFTWILVDHSQSQLLLGRNTLPQCLMTLCLSSHLYVAELLAEWNMAQCKTASTPLPVSPPKTLLKDDQPDDDIKLKYQRLVGCLLYLSIATRPDIAFAAMWLGQHASKPTHPHFLLAKQDTSHHRSRNMFEVPQYPYYP